MHSSEHRTLDGLAPVGKGFFCYHLDPTLSPQTQMMTQGPEPCGITATHVLPRDSDFATFLLAGEPMNSFPMFILSAFSVSYGNFYVHLGFVLVCFAWDWVKPGCL